MKIVNVGHRIGYGIDANVETLRRKSVIQIAEDVASSVHGSAALVGGVHPGAHPLEVAGLTSINRHVEIGSGRFALTPFGGAFDGQRERVRDRFAELGINFREMFAI